MGKGITNKDLMMLRKRRDKLLNLAKKKKKVEMQKKERQREEMRIKREIKQLQLETSKKFSSKVRRALRDPETKKKIKRGGKAATQKIRKVGKSLKAIDKFLKKQGI